MPGVANSVGFDTDSKIDNMLACRTASVVPHCGLKSPATGALVGFWVCSLVGAPVWPATGALVGFWVCSLVGAPVWPTTGESVGVGEFPFVGEAVGKLINNLKSFSISNRRKIRFVYAQE